jgi:hypothetical protein
MVMPRLCDPLSLTLLEARVLLVDDEPLALSNDDLAILGASLDAAADFHDEHSRSLTPTDGNAWASKLNV